MKRPLALCLFVLFAVVVAIPLLTPEKRPERLAIDGWSHVLSRLAMGGAPNAEGRYASSYTRVWRSRAGEEKTFLLVDSAERETALAEALLGQGFVREAAFHARNVVAYHPEAAARAREVLAHARRRGAHVEPLTLLFDGMAPVEAEAADAQAVAAGRYAEVAARHPRTGLAFATHYAAALEATGGEAAAHYRAALAIVQVPALPVVVPAGVLTPDGYVDDAGCVVRDARCPADAEPGVRRGSIAGSRLFYAIAGATLAEAERDYKRRFLRDAAAILGPSEEIDRARVYVQLIPSTGDPSAIHPLFAARGARPLAGLDAEYARLVRTNPYLRIDVPSIVTAEPSLEMRVTSANVERIRYRVARVTGELPREEAALKEWIEKARSEVAYEVTLAPSESRLPLREPGTYRVTAEAAGLELSFVAVRVDARIDAMFFPTETVLVADRPGLAVALDGKALGATGADGSMRVPPVRPRHCAAHVECCKGCESCAHHHSGEFVAGEARIFACDGRVFFRAGAKPDVERLKDVKVPAAGPVLLVYTDRPVYRAGDTVRFRGILRKPVEKIERGADTRLVAVPRREATVSVSRGDEVVFKRTYVTGEFGTFDGECELPATAARAEYALSVECDGGKARSSFEVMDYRKNDFIVTLTPDADGVQVKAGYAWGAPVEGAQVRAYVADRETPIENGRVKAADGESVRVVLARGSDELASKTITFSAPKEAPVAERKTDRPAEEATAPKTQPPAQLPVRTSRRVYGHGETIDVEIAGPDGDAFVALGDVQAYDWQRVRIAGGRAVARFAATGAMDPGVTVFAAIGDQVHALPIEVSAQRMRVEVVPDRASARPGEDVGVTVRARPESAVSLAGVDEAVYMIKEDATPELYATFHTPRPAAMAFAHFGGFSYDGAVREAERPPQASFICEATRVEGAVIRGEAFGAGGRYGGRLGGRRNLVARGGGGSGTADAVQMGLVGLARAQQADGSWPDEAARGAGPLDAHGTTGVALLAFLGAGYSHLSRDTHGGVCFGDVVKNALQFLMRRQGADGFIGRERAGEWLVNHAFAALALTEAYGMTGSNLFKDAAQSALDFVIAQQGPDGGWHPRGERGGETPMTALAVSVLKSAELAGLSFTRAPYDGARRYLNAVYRDDGLGTYADACWMLAVIYIDRVKSDPRLLACASRIVRDMPDAARPQPATWHAAANALFQFDGPDGAFWTRYNQSLKEAVLAQRGGSVYQTAINALSMEVYYRYANVFGYAGGTARMDPPVKPRVRVFFPDTALWIPELVTDSKGEARATLTMPDSITTVRLTARGVTKGAAAGEGMARVESKLPFFVNLKTPAFFVAGDEPEIRAEIFNYTGADVNVECALTGDGFAHMGESMHRVRVGASMESVAWRVRIVDRERVRFRVEAAPPSPGDRRQGARAGFGEPGDAMERTVPVRPATPATTRIVRGTKVVVPAGEQPLDFVLRVSPKNSPLSRVLEALRYLNEYPHG